jgi:3-phosphoshikimate 1-carboxyvinyltransferase
METEDGGIRARGVSRLRLPEDVINAENSGTTIRLMTSLASLPPEGYCVLTGDHSIRQRPMQPLLDALGLLGVEAWSTRLNGRPPVVVKAGGFKGGYAEIRGDISSQFVSSLLIAGVHSRVDTKLRVVGKRVSEPYVDATLEMIRRYGGTVDQKEPGLYMIPPHQVFKPADFAVPGDFSSAAFMVAAGALAGGEISVRGIDFDLPQADRSILEIAQVLGVRVRMRKERGEFQVNGGEIGGGTFDLSNSPDLLPVVATMALKASGEVRISGVAHARFKETDRISVLAQELGKLGVTVEEQGDGLVVKPGARLRKCILDAHDDHRMFMAFCLAGLCSDEGVVVEGAESVDVSYPGFIQDMRNLGARIEVNAA